MTYLRIVVLLYVVVLSRARTQNRVPLLRNTLESRHPGGHSVMRASPPSLHGAESTIPASARICIEANPISVMENFRL